MARLRQLAWMALVAGIAGGLLLSVLQAVWITPLIIQAERYEHPHQTGDIPANTIAHREPDPAPGFDTARTAWSVMGNLIAGVGFALVLAAAVNLRKLKLSMRGGLAWGLGGYACFVMAPAFGLPPELPGMAAADLWERQVWWVSAVAAAAGGLWVLFFAAPRIKPLGIPVLLVPHLIGAPHPPPDGADAVPAALAAQYVSSVLIVNAVFWAVLGACLAWAAQWNSRNA